MQPALNGFLELRINSLCLAYPHTPPCSAELFSFFGFQALAPRAFAASQLMTCLTALVTLK